MAGFLIKDTTREEREQIVADSLGNIDAYCDGCAVSQRCIRIILTGRKSFVR